MLTIGVSGKKGKEKTFPNYFDKMTKKTKIGLIQLKISKNVELNIKNAISKIKVASNKGAKIIKPTLVIMSLLMSLRLLLA